jgi:hypothetical protein
VSQQARNPLATGNRSCKVSGRIISVHLPAHHTGTLNGTGEMALTEMARAILRTRTRPNRSADWRGACCFCWAALHSNTHIRNGRLRLLKFGGGVLSV